MQRISSDIIFLTHSGKLGGGELSLLDIVKTIKSNSLVVFFSDGPAVSLYKNSGIKVKIHKLPNSFLKIKSKRFLFTALINLPMLIIWFFKLLLIIWNSKLIHTNSQKSHLLLFFPCKILMKKWIIHYRDILNKDKFKASESKLIRIFLNYGPNIIFANSKRTANSLVEFGITNKIEIIYNYLPIIEYDFTVKSTISKPFKILYPSRFAKWKGQENFLNALMYIKSEIEVIMISDDIFNSEEINLSTKEKELPKNVKIKFLNFQSDLKPLYLQSDLIIHLPIEPEPFGRVILESICFKRCILVCDNSSLDGFIKDNITGFLVDSLEPKNIASKIDSLIKNSSNFEQISLNANSLAKTTFSREKTLDIVLHIISNIANIDPCSHEFTQKKVAK